MFTVENSVCLPSPLPRVWRAISEAERYRQWHLLIELTVHKDDPCKVMVRHRKYGVLSEGEIVRSQPQSTFAWRVRLWPLFEWEEEFQLERTPHATQLVHKIHIRGFLSVLGMMMSKKGMRRSLIAIDQSLGRYLACGLAPKAALPRRRSR